MKIGYVGLGEMGGALAQRLQIAHQLTVFDLSADAVRRLSEYGARPAASVAELGAQCDVVFMCLPTSAHVERAVFGDDGLAAAMRPGSWMIDQTTADPSATKAVASRLAERGIEFVDAPVSGGRQGAEAGTIAIMVGASVAQYATVHPILEAISPNIFHCGEVGAGHVMKLVNNMLSSAQRLLSFESIALAVKNGIFPSKAIEILVSGGARNAFLEKSMPPVVNGDLGAAFSLALMHKDVKLACELGSTSGVPLLYGNLTKELYQLAINERGSQDKVNAAAFLFDRMAGTRVVPADAR